MKLSLAHKKLSNPSSCCIPTIGLWEFRATNFNFTLICAVAIIFMGFLIPSSECRVISRPSRPSGGRHENSGTRTIVSRVPYRPSSYSNGIHAGISPTHYGQQSSHQLGLAMNQFRPQDSVKSLQSKGEIAELDPEMRLPNDDPGAYTEDGKSSHSWGAERRIQVVRVVNAKDFFGSYSGVGKAKQMLDKPKLNFLELQMKDPANYNLLVNHIIDFDKNGFISLNEWLFMSSNMNFT